MRRKPEAFLWDVREGGCADPLTHGYAVLDHGIVWSVIEMHLPELEKAVTAQLEKGPNEVQESRSAWSRYPVDLGQNLMLAHQALIT